MDDLLATGGKYPLATDNKNPFATGQGCIYLICGSCHGSNLHQGNTKWESLRNNERESDFPFRLLLRKFIVLFALSGSKDQKTFSFSFSLPVLMHPSLRIHSLRDCESKTFIRCKLVVSQREHYIEFPKNPFVSGVAFAIEIVKCEQCFRLM